MDEKFEQEKICLITEKNGYYICTCDDLNHRGFPCAHIFNAWYDSNYQESYLHILPRWRKDYEEKLQSLVPKDDSPSRLNQDNLIEETGRFTPILVSNPKLGIQPGRKKIKKRRKPIREIIMSKFQKRRSNKLSTRK